MKRFIPHKRCQLDVDFKKNLKIWWSVLVQNRWHKHFLYSLHLSLIQNRLKLLIQQNFLYKDGKRRYNCLVLGHDESNFAWNHIDSKNKYIETIIIEMLVNSSLATHLFDVSTDGRHSIGYQLYSLLPDLFLYSYEAELGPI